MSSNTPSLIPPQALEQPYCTVPQFQSALRPEEVLLALTSQMTKYTVRQDIPYQDTTFLALNKCPKYHLNAKLKCQS